MLPPLLFFLKIYYYGSMVFKETSLKGAYLIKPRVFRDPRGFFLESYSQRKFAEAGIEAAFVQDNHSLSASRGVLRGMHFQAPEDTQAKLVRVIKGRVFDVIVDLRKNSQTFGKWEGFELSADNFLILYVPRGFAHGFCTLEDNTEFEYKCDNFYNPEKEAGFIWNDPDLKIDWPVKNPILSEKDTKLQFFKDLKSPF